MSAASEVGYRSTTPGCARSRGFRLNVRRITHALNAPRRVRDDTDGTSPWRHATSLGDKIMFRKFALGLAAAVAVSCAALAPTSASAGGFFHHHHHHYHGGIYFAPAPLIVAGPAVSSGCLQRQLVPTRKGLRWRLVNVCAY